MYISYDDNHYSTSTTSANKYIDVIVLCTNILPVKYYQLQSQVCVGGVTVIFLGNEIFEASLNSGRDCLRFTWC